MSCMEITHVDENGDFYIDDDEYSLYDFNDQITTLERESAIGILRGKEINTIAFDSSEQLIAGILYTELFDGEFSFDVIVSKRYRRKGIAKKLIDTALDEYRSLSDSGIKLKLEVVNPNLVEYLKKLGLKETEKHGDTIIMTESVKYKTEEQKIWESLNNRRIIYEDVQGEYWIDESGNAQYADGDVGDLNHEMIVSMGITSELLGYFDIMVDEPPVDFNNLTDEIDGEIFTYMVDNDLIEDDGETDKYEIFMNDKFDIMERYLRSLGIENIDAKLKVAYDQIDSRLYALEYDGWKRVHGNWIETWQMSESDLKTIVSGINDILDQEGIYDDEKETFNIEIRKTNRTFTDIPWSVLSRGQIRYLIQYRDS